MKKDQCVVEAVCMPATEDIIGKMLSVRGKLKYTQGIRRDDIEGGYADCSSLVQWAYKSAGIDIGEDTAVQIVSSAAVDVDCAGVCREGIPITVFGRSFFNKVQFPMPDVKCLMPGDLLFFTGGDASRPFGVGHVEMYLGDGKIIGQNDRPYRGPTVKDLKTYIKEIGQRGCLYIKTRRVLH